MTYRFKVSSDVIFEGSKRVVVKRASWWSGFKRNGRGYAGCLGLWTLSGMEERWTWRSQAMRGVGFRDRRLPTHSSIHQNPWPLASELDWLGGDRTVGYPARGHLEEVSAGCLGVSEGPIWPFLDSTRPCREKRNRKRCSMVFSSPRRSPSNSGSTSLCPSTKIVARAYHSMVFSGGASSIGPRTAPEYQRPHDDNPAILEDKSTSPCTPRPVQAKPTSFTRHHPTIWKRPSSAQ